MEKLVYTVVEMGELLGVSRATAYQMVNEGRVPAIRLTERRWVIPKEALREFLAEAACEGERGASHAGDGEDEDAS